MLASPMATVSQELAGASRLSSGGELSSSNAIRSSSWSYRSGRRVRGNDALRYCAVPVVCWGGRIRGRGRRNCMEGRGSGVWGLMMERNRSRELATRIVVRSGGGDNKNDRNYGDDQVETLFMRELRRRGMSSKERDGAPLGPAGTETKTKEESEGGGSFFRGWASTKPSPPLTESQRDEQLKRSMALNSEGLDGLIPRGTELLKLGSSFFLVFWPLILASLAAFGAVYLLLSVLTAFIMAQYFGPAFIHTGNSFEEAGRPPYVDPYQILEDPLPPQLGQTRVPYNERTADTTKADNFP